MSQTIADHDGKRSDDNQINVSAQVTGEIVLKQPSVPNQKHKFDWLKLPLTATVVTVVFSFAGAYITAQITAATKVKELEAAQIHQLTLLSKDQKAYQCDDQECPDEAKRLVATLLPYGRFAIPGVRTLLSHENPDVADHGINGLIFIASTAEGRTDVVASLHMALKTDKRFTASYHLGALKVLKEILTPEEWGKLTVGYDPASGVVDPGHADLETIKALIGQKS